MSRIRPVFVACGIAVLSLGAGHGAEPPTWRITNAPPEFASSISRADLIIVKLQDSLLIELTGALQSGGPQLAMKSCHIDATAVAQRIAREEGIAAGRTSDRLRSPTNAPRSWAAPMVREYAGRPAKDIDGFVVDLGDRVGVLRPIAERPMCAGCHGAPERLSAAVREALADRYPADRAVGFSDGEIRGWYWVEIPKVRP